MFTQFRAHTFYMFCHFSHERVFQEIKTNGLTKRPVHERCGQKKKVMN